MMIDVHAHIMSFDVEADIGRLRSVAQRYGVDRYYFSSLDGSAHPDEENVAQGNAYAAKIVKDDPKLFRGYVHVNPRNSDAADVLKKGIEEHGVQVTKEYVKGRGNVYSNPAINAYVHVTDSANKTVSTLKRILRDCEADDSDSDPLVDAINGNTEE